MISVASKFLDTSHKYTGRKFDFGWPDNSGKTAENSRPVGVCLRTVRWGAILKNDMYVTPFD